MAVGLFLLISAPSFGQKEYKVIAIGFYNCENFFDTLHDPNKKDEETTPTPKDYLQKQHNIATVIEKLGTDVTPDGAAMVGLAEVENDNVLKDLIAQPELNVATESLPGKRTTRDILYVYGVLGGDTVHILVNHWPSKSGGEAASAPGRRLAASVAKKQVDSILNKDVDAKILIMGDLNDNPTSEGVVKILNAKAEKKDVELNGIFNPWINMYKKGLGTESYMHEWNLIDQIMVSGSFLTNNNKKWKFYNAEIFNKDFLTYHIGYNKGLPHRSYTAAHVWDDGYSDHFPVLIYLIEKK